MNTLVAEVNTPRSTLAIVEKYEAAVKYLYPLLINMSRKHRVLRDSLLHALFDQYRLFYEAAKSRQISKTYIADAGLAHIKGILRFMADPSTKIISRRQYEIASVILAETGAMIGGWIRHAQKR